MTKAMITVISNRAKHIYVAAIMTNAAFKAITAITVITTIMVIIVSTSIVTTLYNKAKNTSVSQHCSNFSNLSMHSHQLLKSLVIKGEPKKTYQSFFTITRSNFTQILKLKYSESRYCLANISVTKGRIFMKF